MQIVKNSGFVRQVKIARRVVLFKEGVVSVDPSSDDELVCFGHIVTIEFPRYAREETHASTARFAYTFTISRRYSGVSPEVVSGLAILAASSPTSIATCSSICLSLSALPAPFTSSGAGFTAVIATRAFSTGPPFFGTATATATPASG